ncbi:hypothetical protein N5C54_15155 [Pseudomonas chengduensis]|uniref:hypothetical protein n=1 Tax=Pseudomonas sp. o96-267 TaxID=2479853 RepID=UPI000F79C45A|nr:MULTISPECIES: hypothetical protein [Pseudomonas]MDH0959120.1 hypothetical protein [Pseudomonas chengduensis]MDV5863572.1 hypothetical protein [Pseudomonas mendocina]
MDFYLRAAVQTSLALDTQLFSALIAQPAALIIRELQLADFMPPVAVDAQLGVHGEQLLWDANKVSP